MEQQIGRLSSHLQRIPSKLLGIPQSDLEHKPSPTKWSKKEILGHLIDSALNNIQRFIRAQYQNTPHIVYHQDHWVQLQHYQSVDWNQMVDLWKQLNQQTLHIWKNIPVENLHMVCDTGKEGTEIHDLEFLIKDYNDHLEHHLGQIFPNS